MNTPDNNPKTRVGGMNKVPLHLVPPRALAHVAMGYADGGMKYQPYNWHREPISASVYYGAALRHIHAWWSREDNAPDSNVHHLAHAACCLLMLLDTMDTGWLNDNRPAPIGEEFSDLLDRLAGELPDMRLREGVKYDLHDIAQGGVDEECPFLHSEDPLQEVFDLMGEDPAVNYIPAIKRHREIVGCHLVDSKAFVDVIREDIRRERENEEARQEILSWADEWPKRCKIRLVDPAWMYIPAAPGTIFEAEYEEDFYRVWSEEMRLRWRYIVNTQWIKEGYAEIVHEEDW
jgi:hypothetical protein